MGIVSHDSWELGKPLGWNGMERSGTDGGHIYLTSAADGELPQLPLDPRARRKPALVVAERVVVLALVGPLAVAAVEVHHFGAVVGRLVVVVAATQVIGGVLLCKGEGIREWYKSHKTLLASYFAGRHLLE